MKAQKLMAQTRLYAGDAMKAKYSDWQVIRALNDALRVMAEENANAMGRLFRGRAEVEMTGGVGTLPSDYLRVIRGVSGESGSELLHVHSDAPSAGEFSIRGDELYSGETEKVELWYFSNPGQIADGDSDVPVPERYTTAIAKAAAALLTGSDGGAITVADYFLPDAQAAPQPPQQQGD